MALESVNRSGGEEVITTGCSSHCGGACLLKVHVKDGVITRIETDDGETPQLRACLRGRAYRQRVYAPSRLKHPLKRSGERGEGRFKEISWDEALDTIANEYKRIKKDYGPASVLYTASVGDMGVLHTPKAGHRLFCLAGGCTSTWGWASFEAKTYALLATYGTVESRYTHDNFLHSKLIILWGINPTTTIFGCGTNLKLMQAKESGTRIICVDPRYTETAAVLAHQWIPIRPGTDTAMMLAMAYVMIRENIYDQGFIDKYTYGFDTFRDYVLGKEDGIAKSPDWAEPITGVPSSTIVQLAREYATTKPAALVCGISPGRSAMGEQYHRAGITLIAMTGNIGILGGSTGDANPEGDINQKYLYPWKLGGGMRSGKNPVEIGTSVRKYALAAAGGDALDSRVHTSLVWDAILKGKAGGYPADIKMLFIVNTNRLNQYPNLRKGIKALKSDNLEFVAVLEQFMTPAAKFADIILPTNTFMERNEVTGGMGPHLAYGRRIIDSIGESKSHFQIFSELAPRMGVTDYTDKTEEEWLEQIAAPAVADFNTFKRKGVHKIQFSEPLIPFKKQIEDPGNNPFPTPSGKIEIYSQELAKMNNPMIPPIPKFMESWEGLNDPLKEEYPLQLITSKLSRRAHTQFDNITWLRELIPQTVCINTTDAQARGIENGSLVRVFNDRGEMIIPATVTERIMPGVVNVYQGAWFDPDKNGVDRGGCANVLTKDEPSPGGAFPSNTALVQVEKV